MKQNDEHELVPKPEGLGKVHILQSCNWCRNIYEIATNRKLGERENDSKD